MDSSTNDCSKIDHASIMVLCAANTSGSGLAGSLHSKRHREGTCVYVHVCACLQALVHMHFEGAHQTRHHVCRPEAIVQSERCARVGKELGKGPYSSHTVTSKVQEDPSIFRQSQVTTVPTFHLNDATHCPARACCTWGVLSVLAHIRTVAYLPDDLWLCIGKPSRPQQQCTSSNGSQSTPAAAFCNLLQNPPRLSWPTCKQTRQHILGVPPPFPA